MVIFRNMIERGKRKGNSCLFFLNSCWVSDNLNNLILRIYDQTSNFSMIHELS